MSSKTNGVASNIIIYGTDPFVVYGTDPFADPFVVFS